MKVYDKNILKKNLEKHDTIKSFKNVKNILFQTILEDLALAKSEKVMAWKYMIEHIKMHYLYQRGMYDECLQHFEILHKIKEKDSSASSSFLYTRYQYMYFEQLQLSRKTKNSIEKIEKEYDNSIEEILLENKILKAVFHLNILRLDILNLSFVDSSPKILAYKKKYIDVIPARVESPNIKLMSSFYYLLISYNILEKNFDKSLSYTGEYISLFNEKNKIKNFIHEYINALLFAAGIRIITSDTKDSSVYLDKQAEVLADTTLTNYNSIYAYAVWCSNTIQTYIIEEKWNTLIEFLNKNEGIYRDKTTSIAVKFYFDVDFSFAKAHFFLKEFEKCFYYLDKIIAFYSPISKEYNSLLLAAKTLYILINIEMGNFESNEYAIDNLYQSLQRNNIAIEYDQITLKELKKLNSKGSTLKQADYTVALQKIEQNNTLDRLESYTTKTSIKKWLAIKS
ncbi:MAG: hypothetical protein ACPG4Z_07120 [Chitinophagales bacterium]